MVLYKHENDNYVYWTRGVCPRKLSFDLDNNHVVTRIMFDGGCSGNTKGIACLASGMKAEEIISRCKGIKCGAKNTSCPDQLAKALEDALAKLS